MKKLDILELFNTTRKTVPAYRKFLLAHAPTLRTVTSSTDFKRVPITDKNNYIYTYQFNELFPAGKVPAMLYASSGSSGKSTYWARNKEQEMIGADIHEHIFRDIFEIRKEDSTLVIICFSMGVWVAGNYTLSACRYVSEKGYNMTTITPGIEKEDIFSILKNVAPNFKNIIIAGYPPFVMDILLESEERKIHLTNQDKFILTAGDKFTEEWRDTVKTKFGLRSGNHIIGIYGSADTGILGHETPSTISLRRLALKDKNLYKKLFGDSDIMPAIAQYHPEHIYFENADKELVLTTNTSCPLIRYNIHDIGSVHTWKEILDTTRGLKVVAPEKGNMGFLVIKGRTDVAVTFYALNIYPEHIISALRERGWSKFFTGSFKVYNKTTAHGTKQKLYVELELLPNIKIPGGLRLVIANNIVKRLTKINIEFRKLYSSIQEKAVPVVLLRAYHDKRFFKSNVISILNIKGKKPKILLPK